MALDGTYTGLKASIADFLNRSDLTSAIPDFIVLAEAQLNRRFIQGGPIRWMQGRSDATITGEFVTVPTDFVGLRAIYLTETSTKQLTFCTPEQIVQKKSNTTTLTGDPEFVAVVNNSFQFFPAPTTSLSAELTYWARIPALSGSNATNWLLTYHPDAYLYTSLIQSAPYLKEDARISTWAALASQIADDIIEANKTELDAPYIAVPDVSGGTP